jgi:WD40 repeat protein
VEPILVVDAGTATTQAYAVLGETKEILTDPGFLHGDYWPTAVARDGAGFIVGGAAVQPAIDQGLARGRFLGQLGRPGARLVLGDAVHPPQSYSPEGLLAELLRELRLHAGRPAGREVRRVLLTVPDSGPVPGFLRADRRGAGRDIPRTAADGRGHDTLRAGLVRAARLAGFTDVELLSETAAASLGAPRQKPQRNVLIADAGASALRLTVWRAGSAHDGDPGSVVCRETFPALGGDRIDEQLAERISSSMARDEMPDRGQTVLGWFRGRKSGAAPPVDADGPDQRDEYLDKARDLRHQLTRADEALVSLRTLDRKHFSFRREDLRKLLSRQLEELGEACHALTRAGLDIQDVLLVGGCAQMPLLADGLREFLGRAAPVDVRPLDQPDWVAVAGARSWALHAGSRRIEALPHRPGTRDLAWQFKDGGGARITKWLVAEGSTFEPGDPLAAVRGLDDDSACYLTADFSGTLLRHCVTAKTTDHPGQVVDSREVLAVADVRPAEPAQLCTPYLVPGARAMASAAMAFSPDGGELAAVDRDGVCYLRDMQTGTEKRLPHRLVLSGPGCDLVCTTGPGPADRDWLAGHVDGDAVTVVSIRTGEQRGRSFRGGWAIRFGAGGSRACVLGDREIRVSREDGGRWHELYAEKVPDYYADALASVAYSRDGGTLVYACRDKKHRSRREPGAGTLFVRDAAVHRAIGAALPAGAQPAFLLAVSPDGSRVMLAIGRKIEIWDASNNMLMWEHPVGGTVRAAEFSPDGNLLVTAIQAQSSWIGALWDARPAQPKIWRRQFDLEGRSTTWVRISPDNRFLVTGNENHSALWGLLP